MKLTALPDKTAIVRDSLVRRQSNERLVTLIDDHVPIESRISTEREKKKLHSICVVISVMLDSLRSCGIIDLIFTPASPPCADNNTTPHHLTHDHHESC